MRTSGITALPPSVVRISIWKVYLVFEPQMHTNGKPALYFSILRQVMAALVFFRIVVSVVFLRQKQSNAKAGVLFVGWCMINTVSKNHT